MFLDALGLVSDSQQVTADAVSTNSIDQGNVTPKRAIGTGEPIGFMVAIVAAGTNTGSMIISILESANSNLAAGTKTGQRALATAELAVGKLYFIEVPAGKPAARYLGLDYDVTGTVDVTLKSCLVPRSFFDEQLKVYNKGFTVS